MKLAQLHEICGSFPGATADTPFGPDTVTYRVAGKIYALVPEDPAHVRLNLKCEPHLATQLREEFPEHILAGYHMNKQHWNTVVTAGLEDAFVIELIEDSYDLIVAALPRAQRPAD